MRSGFGRKAQKLRAERGMSQKEFAERAGLSLSRVSDIENQRVAVSEDVIRVYLAVLAPNGDDAHDLRKLASFSNAVRDNIKSDVSHPPLVALFQEFGHRLSPTAVAKIAEIIERETGEQTSYLAFSNNQRTKKGKSKKISRPQLMKQRFVEICLIASRFRSRFAVETEKLNLGVVLEKLSAEDDQFDYRVVSRVPTFLEGAFACIIGQPDGHLLLLEEERFLSAERGVHFSRHVVAHEIAHHILHKNELVTEGQVVFEPQPLSRNSAVTIEANNRIEQVVDSQLEVDAECFATFFLVPWYAFIKGTHARYLASDFGEQQKEIERYLPYFKQDAVVEEFKSQLHQMGEKSHPIFHDF